MNYSLNGGAVELIFEKIRYYILPSKSNNYKSILVESNIFLYCVVLLLALKIATVFVFINFSQNIFFADITKLTLESLANQTRQSSGLQPLIENEKLNQAAQLKAENMVSNNYFAHNSPTGITPWYWFLKTGYNYKYAGENLAIGFYDSQEVYYAWLNSPSHRANLLNPNYKEIGTAILKGFGENNAIVVVQLFGSQKTSAVASNQANKNNLPDNKKPANEESKNDKIAESNENPLAENKEERVLSQSTESIGTLESAKTSSSNFYYRFMNYVLYGYEGILRDIIFGVLLIVTGILLAIIFLSANLNFRKQLVFRSVLVVILLSLATAINKEVVMSIVPHQIII